MSIENTTEQTRQQKTSEGMQKGHDNLSNENLHEGCSNIEKDNVDLSERFQQAEEKVKKTGDHMQHFDFVDIPHVPDQKLWDQLRATER